MTNPAGEIVGVGPAFVVVPPALEVSTRILLNETFAVHGPDRPVLVVNPYLSSAMSWYVFADPLAAPTLALLHLSGHDDRPLAAKGLRVGVGDLVRIDPDAVSPSPGPSD
jgi:hypothetical protein